MIYVKNVIILIILGEFDDVLICCFLFFICGGAYTRIRRWPLGTGYVHCCTLMHVLTSDYIGIIVA